MGRIPVSSSSLAEVGYDSGSETLEIMFRSGGIYQYFNVPAFIHERLLEAGSPGRFFRAEILGHYPETRV
jgi:hypothetical protein